MMEFEEMQKVWDEQKGETMYAINETALHRSVTRKKNAASRRISKVEIMASLINGAMAIFLFFIAFEGLHNWAFISGGLMIVTVAYVQYFRWKRKKAENRFDRSMLGELDHAIANADSIIKLNYFLLIGYLIPVFAISFSKMIFVGASLEKWLIMIVFFLLGFFLMRWEQRACNVPRKKQLLVLKKKLMEE